jgi:hypothetical protein
MMTKLMLLRELTPGQERDVLITVTGTQLGARVGELKRLQVCDLLVDHDVPYSRRFRGSAAVRIRKRKQDQLRRGLYPRLAKGSTARLCVVRRLQRMMARAACRFRTLAPRRYDQRRVAHIVRHSLRVFGEAEAAICLSRDSRSREPSNGLSTWSKATAAASQGSPCAGAAFRKRFTREYRNQFCTFRAVTAQGLRRGHTLFQRIHGSCTRQRRRCACRNAARGR